MDRNKLYHEGKSDTVLRSKQITISVDKRVYTRGIDRLLML